MFTTTTMSKNTIKETLNNELSTKRGKAFYELIKICEEIDKKEKTVQSVKASRKK